MLNSHAQIPQLMKSRIVTIKVALELMPLQLIVSHAFAIVLNQTLAVRVRHATKVTLRQMQTVSNADAQKNQQKPPNAQMPVAVYQAPQDAVAGQKGPMKTPVIAQVHANAQQKNHAQQIPVTVYQAPQDAVAGQKGPVKTPVIAQVHANAHQAVDQEVQAAEVVALAVPVLTSTSHSLMTPHILPPRKPQPSRRLDQHVLLPDLNAQLMDRFAMEPPLPIQIRLTVNIVQSLTPCIVKLPSTDIA